MPKDVTKETKKPTKELVKLPDLNQNFSENVRVNGDQGEIAFRFSLSSLDRLLHLYKFAKDERSSDLHVFYHSGSMVFLKEQLEATKSGAVPVELIAGEQEDVEFVLFNLDYALLQQVYTTMKQIEKDSIILEINKNNSIKYIIGTFELPGKLKETTVELPYSKLDNIELTSVLPSADLRKILDISYNTTESSHSALDNIFLDGRNIVGGTKGLLYRTNTLLPNLECLIGFNYKYYGDIAAFKSLVSGEMAVNLGTSKIRGKDRQVLEFSSYDCRLVIPLAILNDGDIKQFGAFEKALDTTEETGNVQISCSVKALKRSLNCMELALYGLKTTHKAGFGVNGQTVTVSAQPLTNDLATDTLSCNVEETNEVSVKLGVNYLFSALDSFEADDNIIVSIPNEESPQRVKIYGKTKKEDTKSWITTTYID